MCKLLPDKRRKKNASQKGKILVFCKRMKSKKCLGRKKEERETEKGKREREKEEREYVCDLRGKIGIKVFQKIPRGN